jgi:hypothetical protein
MKHEKWDSSEKHLLQQPKNPIATFGDHLLQHPKKPLQHGENK